MKFHLCLFMSMVAAFSFKAHAGGGDTALSISGTWSGYALHKNSASTSPYPFSCMQMSAEATDLNKSCDGEFNSATNGKLYGLNIRCVDQNLSAQGQAIFNRSIQVCETVTDNKRIDGSTFYFTELSVRPKLAPGNFLLLNIDQTPTDVFRINPIPGAKSVIEIHYTGREKKSDSYSDFEARFFRQAN